MRLTIITTLVALSVITAPLAESQESGQTPWGDPSLEGTWVSINPDRVPFERPSDDRDDSILLELVESGVIERVVRRDRFPLSSLQAELVSEARQNALADWRANGALRGSLVVDPPDGRMPALTPAGQARAASAWRTSDGDGPWAQAGDLGPVDRCISRGVVGSFTPSLDYHGTEIMQAPDVVVIRHETMHEARVVWLDGRPDLPDRINGYMGSSRGTWDGGTLVVDTTNINGRTGARAHGNELPVSPQLHVTERFTRTDSATLLYDVTVDDPGTWVAPWRLVFPLALRDDYAMSEYACHEGNYAVRNILSAARAVERRRAQP